MPSGIPVRPPIRKIRIEDRTKRNATVMRSLPDHMVATQAKTFTPVGTATSRVVIMKGTRSQPGRPAANMWWAKTIVPPRAMPGLDIATPL